MKTSQSKHSVDSHPICAVIIVTFLVLAASSTVAAEPVPSGSLEPRHDGTGEGVAPTVANPPTVVSLDCTGDTEGVLYARYRDYRLRCICSDGDGADDIDQVSLTLAGPGGECVLTYDASRERFESRDNKSELFDLNKVGCKARESKDDLTVDFVGRIAWAFGDVESLQVTVDVSDKSEMESSSLVDLNMRVESDIEIDSGNWVLHDVTMNPQTPATATIRIEYQGSGVLVPEEEIASVSVVSANDEVMGTAIGISEGDVDYVTGVDVGPDSYHPVVQLLGGGTYDFGKLATPVTLDMVKVTALEVSGEVYDDGIKWDNNDGISDDMTVAATAEWMYGETRFLGDFVLGYDGDPDGYGVAVAGQASVTENVGHNNVVVRSNVRVTSAVENEDNVYGPALVLAGGVTPLTLGWDSEPPEITGSGWVEDSDYLHASGTLLFVGRGMSGNVSAEAAGSATDNGGSGLSRAEFSDENISSPCPCADYTADQWSGEYTMNSKSVLVSTPATITVYDNVGNSTSVELPYTRDDDPPSGYYSDAPKRSNKSYEVTVHGADDYAGSGVKCVYLDVFSSNGGEPTFIRSSMKGVTSRDVTYYRYYAMDNVGNKGPILSDRTVNDKFRITGVLGADGDVNKGKTAKVCRIRSAAAIRQARFEKHVDTRIASADQATPVDESSGYAADEQWVSEVEPDDDLSDKPGAVIVHPNPVRPGDGTGVIHFAGARSSSSVSIFDVRGALIAEVHDNDNDGVVTWDIGSAGPNDIASGIYFYVVTASGDEDSPPLSAGKIVILR